MICQTRNNDMELFVICLCIVFGLVSGDPERGEIANENVDVIMEVIDSISPSPSLPFDAAKMIIYPGQKLPGVEGHKSDLSVPGLSRSGNAESGEMGTLGSPSGILKSRNVTESSPKRRKTLPRDYPGLSDTELNMLHKLTYRSISAKFFKRFHGVTALRGTTATTFVNDTEKKHLQRKKRSGLSAGKRRQPRFKIPDKLKAAMKQADYWEEKILLQYVTEHNRTTIDEIASQYIAAQREERWLLKKFIEGFPTEAEAEQLFTTYHSLRIGKASKATESQEDFAVFFNTPSALLTEYKDLKDNELEVDGYLEGTVQFPNEEEFNREMRAKTEYRSLPKPIRNSADLVRMARLHKEEAELRPKVEKQSKPIIKKLRATQPAPVEKKDDGSSNAAQDDDDDDKDSTPDNSRDSIPDNPRDSSPDNPRDSIPDNPRDSSPDNPPEERILKSPAAQLSYSVMKSLLDRLPEVLTCRMDDTDEAEATILDNFKRQQSVPDEITDVYNAKQKEERDLLKVVLKEVGSYAPQIVELYKAVRKGEAWTFQKLDGAFERFFQKPSDALTEYEALKKDEFASLDAFLLGPIETNGRLPDASADTDDIGRRTRAEDGERVRNEEDEKREEMERKLTVEATVTFRTEEMERMETSSGDVNVTTQDVNGTDDILRSPDNVTAADHARNKNTANQKNRGTYSMVRIGIILSVPINVILAMVILGLYRKDILEWYRLRKTSRAILADGEKELLHSGRKVSTV